MRIIGKRTGVSCIDVFLYNVLKARKYQRSIYLRMSINSESNLNILLIRVVVNSLSPFVNPSIIINHSKYQRLVLKNRFRLLSLK